MQAQNAISAGCPCPLVVRFFYRHAHAGKHRISFSSCSPRIDLSFGSSGFPTPKSLLQITSLVEEENTWESNSGTKSVKVKFAIQRRCEFGQQFNIIGDNKLLGAWDPEAAIPMQWSEGHVWTSEVDLPAGMQAEFKIILMADQEVIEWLPGPNCRFEIPEVVPSLEILVPWSDETGTPQNNAPIAMEMDDLSSSQEADDTSTSQHEGMGILEVEANDFPIKLADQERAEKQRTDNGPVQVNVEDVSDEKQVDVHQPIEAPPGVDHNLEPVDVLSSFAIPESWYVEETKTSTGQTKADESDGNREDLMLRRELVEARSEMMALPVEIQLNREEGNLEKANDRRAAESIGGTRSNNVDEGEDTEKLGPVVTHAEPHLQVRASATLASSPEGDQIREEVVVHEGSATSQEEDQIGEEIVDHDGSIKQISKVPEIEAASTPDSSVDSMKPKPSVLEKDMKWGRKALFRLWGALVQGHSDDKEA